MNGLIGCLFILIFGGILAIMGFASMIFQLLFGQRRPPRNTSHADPHTQRPHTSTGNAHHENSRGNSRQRRSGKIFEKNEGKYVDFEEV